MDVTVGIITWRARELLRHLLDSLYANLDGISHEVIVVDNASGDGTLEIVERDYSQVMLIRNQVNEGVTLARNRILRAAQGRYILSLDVDTTVLPGAIPTLVRTMDEQSEAALGGPKLVYRDGRLQLSCRPFPTLLNILLEGTPLREYFPDSRYVKEYTLEDWDHNELREVDWMYGACLIIRKAALDRLGLFDEGFFYLYEDVDLCFRAKKLGMKVIYIPQALICHHLERERKGFFHPRIIPHVRSILRYLYKDYYGFSRSR